MRILMLTDVYFPRVNGVSSSIRTFCRELARRGHEPVVVAPDYPLPMREEAFEVRRLPARTIFFDPEDRWIRSGALRRAEAELSAGGFDLIHVHTPFQAHRLGMRLARRHRLPLVESYHTYFEQYAAHYLPWAPASWLRAGARVLSRRTCAGVDHLIVPTREMSEVLDRYGIATPRTIVPTGLDLEEFSGGDGLRFRLEHDIAVERPVLVTVSRVAREKNIDLLMQATRVLTERFPDVLLLIAGEGPDTERLHALRATLGLERHVRFFGNLDRRTTLLDFYRAGDAFVFASPTETQGLVLIEAAALGVPVVSTAVMGTATVLAGARGAVVAPEDAAGFASAVTRVLADGGLRAELSRAARDDARRWSAPVLMEPVVELYAELARRRAPAPVPTAAVPATHNASN